MMVSATSTSEPIKTEDFPELRGKSSNPREARVAFARVMRARGYRRGHGRTWLVDAATVSVAAADTSAASTDIIKAGCAAVMEPR